MKYAKVLVIGFLLIGGGVMIEAAKRASKVPAGINLERVVKVRYTNWRGETGIRTIVPIEIVWGKTEFHPKEQWLLYVWDVDRLDYRMYALSEIKEWLTE